MAAFLLFYLMFLVPSVLVDAQDVYKNAISPENRMREDDKFGIETHRMRVGDRNEQNWLFINWESMPAEDRPKAKCSVSTDSRVFSRSKYAINCAVDKKLYKSSIKAIEGTIDCDLFFELVDARIGGDGFEGHLLLLKLLIITVMMYLCACVLQWMEMRDKNKLSYLIARLERLERIQNDSPEKKFGAGVEEP